MISFSICAHRQRNFGKIEHLVGITERFNDSFIKKMLFLMINKCFILDVPFNEFWNSRVTNLSYKTELRKMTSQLELLTQKSL